jgi:TP901 family phage tail tape measure protein
VATDLVTSIRIKLLDAFSAPLARISSSLKGLKGEFAGVSAAFKLGADMRQAAEGAGAFGSMLVGALRPGFEEFKGFESQLSELAAISGEIGTKAFGDLKKQAADLGAATSYSGTEAAAAMTELARAGRNATEIMAITPTVLSLARASGMSLAQTAETLGGAMNGLGLDAAQSAHAADVMAKTFTSSATSLGDLGEAFKMAAPLAKQANISVEQLSTAIGVLGNAGIRGTMAGTGLQGVMLGLVAPTKMSSKYLGEIGLKGEKLKTLQKTLASGNLGGAIRQIGEATAKLPDEKKMRILEGIFGREALKTATVLIDAKLDTESIKGWDALEGKLDKATGTANRMAFVMEDNLAGELERTGGSISSLALQIGERLKPSIVAVATGVQNMIGSVSAWVDKNPELANSLVRLTAVVAGGAFAIKGIVLAASTMVTTFGVLRGAYLVTKGAMIVTAGVTRALAAGMYTRLIPSFIQARIAALAASGPMQALVGSKLGMAGLVVAAGALGWTIGRLISGWFDLDRKLSSTIGWIMGVNLDTETTDKKGVQKGTDRVFGDGTVIDGKTGEVKKLGTGPAALAPKVVRDARAGGAMTADAINAGIRAKRAQAEKPMGPPVAGDPATKEQTKVLDRGQREQTRELKRLREAVERRRGALGGGAPATGGIGAH